ncbi:MAG: CobD/CbiB family cobalamin biosynthesis protein, partial [Acidimicrobiales bacterium]
MSHAWPAAAGLAADAAVGDPSDAVHPVAWFGRAMQQVERVLYRDSRAAGMVQAGIGVALGAGAGALMRSTTLATAMSVAGRSLASTASDVAEALDARDLGRARALLPALAGRDPEGLDSQELARAVVESVAENTVDAVVAPALWAAVAGAPGALGYRAVNTL